MKITFVVVLITPVSFWSLRLLYQNIPIRCSGCNQRQRGEQTGLVDEMIGRQKVVQAFGQQENVMKKFDEINARLGKASLKATFFLLSQILLPDL